MVASSALLDTLVTVVVYVFVVFPSCAVTTVVIVLVPTTKGMAADAAPDFIAVPFTVMLAVESLAVGVILTDAVALLTEAA